MDARSKAILWMILAAVLALIVTLLYIRLVKASNDRLEIRAERVMTDTTPVPTAPPEPLPQTWVRYDVPLDDDIQRYVEKLCREYEIPASVVFAVIEVESGCDPDCMGDHGNSWGLMQIYSICHAERMQRLGVWDLLDPYQNVHVGVDFLAELINIGHGYDWALSYYNNGTGDDNGYAYKVLTEAERLLESAQLVTE